MESFLEETIAVTFTVQEVQKAINNKLHTNKSPDTNGLTAEHFISSSL